jgi:putative transposase
MMADWFTPAEIAAASKGEVPASARGLNRVILRDGWNRDPNKCRARTGRGGGFEYHVSLLPAGLAVRLSLADSSSLTPAASVSLTPSTGSGGGDVGARWARFEGLPEHHKREAGMRLAALERQLVLRESGVSDTGSMRMAAREAGVSMATLYNWRRAVDGFGRADWLAVLAPSYTGSGQRASCDDAAYQMVKSDFLRPEKPSLARCIARVRAVAKREGWAMPSDRSLRRRLDQDVPKAVQKLKRSGWDAAKTLYPAQTRTRAHLKAMQSVNMDGHKFDVFVKMPDGRVSRVFVVGIQDLYSGKLLAWRLAEAENKETVRLVIGDMVEKHGIPDSIYLDNGRSFASKWITGGAATRFRFKVRAEEPQGLLLTLGLSSQSIHWTTPYSGQSKPIERAWRDLTDGISRHPFCAGAYTGNKPDAKPENYGSKAIPLEDFRAHVSREIIEHNSREGRRTETAQGRSFDATFAASLADPKNLVTRAAPSQRALWLLAAEQIRTRKGNGEIHFMGNRYWHEALTGHANASVTLRFDPDNLKDDLRVYDSKDRLICLASCIDATGFDDQDAARAHGRDRRAYVNALKAQAELHVKLSAGELARVYAAGAPQAEEKQTSKVTRLARPSAAKASHDSSWDEEAAADFSRGLRLVGGNAA